MEKSDHMAQCCARKKNKIRAVLVEKTFVYTGPGIEAIHVNHSIVCCQSVQLQIVSGGSKR